MFSEWDNSLCKFSRLSHSVLFYFMEFKLYFFKVKILTLRFHMAQANIFKGILNLQYLFIFWVYNIYISILKQDVILFFTMYACYLFLNKISTLWQLIKIICSLVIWGLDVIIINSPWIIHSIGNKFFLLVRSLRTY